MAQTITVNSTADDNGSGECALREAINLAQGTTPICNCAGSGAGASTIAFSVSGTITLTSTLPAILSPETPTIEGPATTPPSITIDGATMYQVMSVNSGATLNIDDLTIADRSSGPKALASQTAGP